MAPPLLFFHVQHLAPQQAHHAMVVGRADLDTQTQYGSEMCTLGDIVDQTAAAWTTIEWIASYTNSERIVG